MATPSLRSLGANTRLSMLNKPRVLATRQEFAADIQREWSNALEATVAVGRRLNEAKATLPHGEYEAMVESDLPFTAATARKLRKAAELVDSGEIALDRLPESYTTLYAIATLPDDTRQLAVEQGVIRPEVTRAELEALKPPKPAAPEAETRREALRVGLADLFAGPATLPAPPEAEANVWEGIEATKPAPVAGPTMEEVWGLVCAVPVPELLLMRLDGQLDARGLRGPSTIVLRYAASHDHLTLHRRGDAYEIAGIFTDNCTYVGPVMPAKRVADFLRNWLDAPVNNATIIDVEAVPVPVTPALPAPAAEPKASPMAGATDRPWSVDPADRCSILVRADDGKEWVALTTLHFDNAAAGLIEYVVDLHNARLMGGR